MDVLEAVSSRYSCRAFLPTPIPEQTVREIVERAARAPSAGSMQPRRVYAIAGKRVEDLKAALGPRMATELPKGEGTDYTIYPEPLTEPYRERRFTVGELLYRSIKVSREDKSARYRQYARNYQFFGAPVALFFAREKVHGPAQWADIGGYLQTVALLARGFGLRTCPQQACVSFHRILRGFLGLPDNLMIYSGMAQDGAAPINSWRSPRALPSTPTHRSRASIASGKQAFTSVQVAFTGTRLTPYLCRFLDSSRPCCCWAPSAPRPWGPMALTARVSQEPNNELRLTTIKRFRLARPSNRCANIANTPKWCALASAEETINSSMC